MNVFFCLLLAAAEPAPDASVFYTAPAEAADREASKHDFPRHAVDSTVYAALDEVNVRASAAADAPVVVTLPMGSPVVVKEVNPGVDTVEGRVDTWYRVVAPGGDAGNVEGFVFGAALTPLRFLLDLDDDGEQEVVTVSMGWDFKFRVRVMEPGVVAPRERVSSVSVETAGGGFLGQAGGRATADVVGKKLAGLTLLHLTSAPEACADYSETWVSYRSPGKRKPGKLRVALDAHGMLDPPVFSRFVVKWDARRKTAEVIHTNEAEEEEGKVEKKVVRKKYTLKDGVYRAPK